jgi:hypothetical protein
MTDTPDKADRPIQENPGPTPAGDDLFHSRIIITPDGKVIIENLSMDLMELALMLDPESPVACDLAPAGSAAVLLEEEEESGAQGDPTEPIPK